MNIFEKLFGTPSQREVKAITPIVDKIESLAGKYEAMEDHQLQGQTNALRNRLATGETLDDILPDAFAVCREASKRVLGMYPYRVQLIGGIILHQGRIAEMRTGEGKTLVAALPAYLNGLSGEGVHVVTVNDYLAKRDSEQIGKVYRFLGLTVGLVYQNQPPVEKMAAYRADITYGTNNEFGFDYLRDNMAMSKESQVQRSHRFAIVDEVDSILIDEARTPLIISGQAETASPMYLIADQFVQTLKCRRIASVDAKEEEAPDIDVDYIVDEKARTATLTARGIRKAEAMFRVKNLGDIENTTLAHYINQALRARGVMRRDIDYVVRNGEVVIVDEFTGRVMPGRRYNEGLHQAIEAKEKVQIANESKTFATITFQNFFRLYDKLSGMTGTAMTEKDEFENTYCMDVVEIPTNKPVIRKDYPDAVYRTTAGKLRAIIEKIVECHDRGQPVLIGTVSIEKSEELSNMLRQKGIPHNVLNAKNHEQEACIVAQAGKLGAVTVATNMAGRGTDIMLGGNPEFLAKAEMLQKGIPEELLAEATSYADTDDETILELRREYVNIETKYRAQTNTAAKAVRLLGGLFILGTERHESRRIDNQLRGRAGRQGDPGESRFYLSLEDDIMRLFGANRVEGILDKLGVDDNMPIDAKILSGAIESAQRQVESQHFQARKRVLEYDDVMNTQRKVIYEQRQQVLDGLDIHEQILKMLHKVIRNHIFAHLNEDMKMNEQQLQEMLKPYRAMWMQPDEFQLTTEELNNMGFMFVNLTEKIYESAKAGYTRKEEEFGTAQFRNLERLFLLRAIDKNWMDHLDAMEELKKGIVLRAYAQTDPVVAYKREGYDMFEATVAAIQAETVYSLFRISPPKQEQKEAV